MDNNQLLFVLLKKALMDHPLELSSFDGMSEEDWRKVYELSKQQGVTAIVFDVIQNLPKSLQPSKGLFIQWALFTERCEQRYAKQKASLERIVEVLRPSGIRFMLMKGFSVSKYYSIPNHRECGDIDIYMGNKYSEGNIFIQKVGYSINKEDYRHVGFVIDDVMVENHCMLSDTRARKDNIILEKKLVDIAQKALKTSEDILVSPPVDFTALFLNWHAESHFLFEKIQLRHIYDWALFLKNEGENMDSSLFMDMKRKCTFGRLSDILTSVAVNYLGLNIQDVPGVIWSDAKKVDEKLRNKVLDYIMTSERIEKSGGVWSLRCRLFFRIFRDSWKIREVAGMNPIVFLYRRMVAVLKN